MHMAVFLPVPPQQLFPSGGFNLHTSMGFGFSVSPFFLRPSPYLTDEPVTKGKVERPAQALIDFCHVSYNAGAIKKLYCWLWPSTDYPSARSLGSLIGCY